MAYKYSFADNEAYGASDINAITKRLVTSGIEDSFADGVAYNVSNLNEMGKVIYTQGVVPESCLTLKVVAASDGKILINPGLAFFADGSVIEIVDGGEEMSYVTGAINYVYLKNDLLNMNVSYPYCGTEAPEGDYVMLAEISENGAITDKRTYARGKLPGYQSFAGNVMRIQEYMGITGTDSGYYTASRTFDIGNNNFEYILTYVKRSNVGLSTGTFPCLGIYDISEQSYLGFHCHNENTNAQGNHTSYLASVSEKSLFIRDYPSDSSYEVYLKFAIDNGKLTVTLYSYSRYASKPNGFDIELFLF